jgi:hypothetical protein
MPSCVSVNRDVLPDVLVGKRSVGRDTNKDVTTDMQTGIVHAVWDSSDADRVVLWRTERLVIAGFPADLAFRLAADHDVDVHALLDLVDRGCPPALAIRIAAPLTWLDGA